MGAAGLGEKRVFLGDADYERLCKWIYEETGMAFDSKRRDFVEHRLILRLRQYPAEDLAGYLERLRWDRQEALAFLDSLTVNETYFFRDRAQMEALAEVVETLVREKVNSLHPWLRIWSAGCSIGAEAFTAAILVQEELERQRAELMWEVVGTDISVSALQVAQAALYSDREVRDVPAGLLHKYFRRNGSWWEFYHSCRQRVRFRQSNLLRPGPEVGGPFDVILCRNVLIYFDDQSRREAVDVLFDRLVPGGYLFLGAAESLSRISRAFQLRRLRCGLVYVRP